MQALTSSFPGTAAGGSPASHGDLVLTSTIAPLGRITSLDDLVAERGRVAHCQLLSGALIGGGHQYD